MKHKTSETLTSAMNINLRLTVDSPLNV